MDGSRWFAKKKRLVQGETKADGRLGPLAVPGLPRTASLPPPRKHPTAAYQPHRPLGFGLILIGCRDETWVRLPCT